MCIIFLCLAIFSLPPGAVHKNSILFLCTLASEFSVLATRYYDYIDSVLTV